MLDLARRMTRRQYFRTSLVQYVIGEGASPIKVNALLAQNISQVANNYIFLCSKFLSGLGSLVDTTTTDPGRVYMGGLDPNKDGQFAYIWQDDAMQVKPGYRSLELYLINSST